MVSMMAQSFKVTVTGKICDTQGRGISNVIVNDGFNFVKTNAKGYYRITSDTMISKFISISTPASYILPQKKGIANGFYASMHDIMKTKAKNKIRDFILQPRKNISDKFFYIAISDPQMHSTYDFNRWNNETVKDLHIEVAKLKKADEVIGMTLGDMIFDDGRMWSKYIKSIENTGMTFFQCIGNHDFITRYPDLGNSKRGAKAYAEMYYHRYFGPTDYSFNIGKIHVITLKNIDYHGWGKYVERLTPAEISWLKKDLSFVPQGTTVFINMHAASFNRWDTTANMRNMNSIEPILKDYNVHYFCGHTHYYENEIKSDKLFQHNIGAACGAWWYGDVNRCGAPNGYMIVEVNGNDVKWHYKGTKNPINYQFRIYKKGEFRSQKDYIVVNTWDYDDTCKMEWYEDGKLKGKMDQFLDKDEAYLKIERNPKYGCHTSHLFRFKPTEGAKKIDIVFTNHFGERYSESIEL